MGADELQQWAASHETAIEIAEAIHSLAGGNKEVMQHYWEDPSREEWLYVWERVTKNGLLDGNDFQWGVDDLGNAYREE